MTWSRTYYPCQICLSGRPIKIGHTGYGSLPGLSLSRGLPRLQVMVSLLNFILRYVLKAQGWVANKASPRGGPNGNNRGVCQGLDCFLLPVLLCNAGCRTLTLDPTSCRTWLLWVMQKMQAGRVCLFCGVLPASACRFHEVWFMAGQ